MQHTYPNKDPDGFVGVRYWPPPEHLRPYFGSIYLFTSRNPTFHDTTRADVPQIRFMLSATGHYEFHDGRTATTPEICMVGPTMGATQFFLTGETSVLGISVMSRGWAALSCADASECCDNVYDMAAVHGSQYQAMLEELRSEPNPDAAANHIWAFMESQLRPVPDDVLAVIDVIGAWLEENNSPEVSELIAASGLSARQIGRYTKRLYGASPKLLARKYRALRCAAQLVLDKKSWKELCEEGTFYDQPHFIREIKLFIGLTPHQLMYKPTDVARLTVQRRALTGLVAELNRIS